jgi:hypothetical protein
MSDRLRAVVDDLLSWTDRLHDDGNADLAEDLENIANRISRAAPQPREREALEARLLGIPVKTSLYLPADGFYCHPSILSESEVSE